MSIFISFLLYSECAEKNHELNFYKGYPTFKKITTVIITIYIIALDAIIVLLYYTFACLVFM